MKSRNADSASKTYFNHQPKRAVQFITFESPQQPSHSPSAGPYQDTELPLRPGGTISERKSILKKPSFISKFQGDPSTQSGSHTNRRSRNNLSSASVGNLLPLHTEATSPSHKILARPPSSERMEVRVNKARLHKRMTCVQPIAQAYTDADDGWPMKEKKDQSSQIS